MSTNASGRPEWMLKHLDALRPIFAKAALGDFSEDVLLPDDDELLEIYAGVQMMLEAARSQIADAQESNRTLESRLKSVSRTMQALEQAQREDEAILNSLGEVLVITDAAGNITRINDLGVALFGKSMNELARKLFQETLPLEQNGKRITHTDHPTTRAIQTGKPQSGDYLYHKGDSTVQLSLVASPLRIGSMIAGAVVLAREQGPHQ